MANMAIALKAAIDHCRVLEKENQAKASDLEKAAATRKDLRSAMRAKKEELHEAGDIVAGKPFLVRTKFGDPKYAPLDQLWSSADAYMDLAASVPMRPSSSRIKKIMKWESCSGHSCMLQCVRCC